jgi:hypothetical protein
VAAGRVLAPSKLVLIAQPLSLHRLTFRVEDAATAFEALADLDIIAELAPFAGPGGM